MITLLISVGAVILAVIGGAILSPQPSRDRANSTAAAERVLEAIALSVF